ncbi:MAG: chloride channel protein [Bacteroides sp.]|nr:chloride channel protein [Bacteroides sp.]MCM1414189.1 chloride channel protein [Bacteroides sp.]MCM1472011.1 chloride channel protein [Bacteroides sp.]
MQLLPTTYRLKLSGLLDRFARWHRRYLSSKATLFIAVTVVGLLAGVGAFVLKRVIAAVSHLLLDHFNPLDFNWAFLFIPLIGIVLTGIATRYIMRTHLAHGVRHLKEQLKAKDYYIKPSLIFYPMIASTLTLGFGGSAGSEGPIACTGAAIGGNIGRWLRLDSKALMLMIGCGAGAGIAGIFKSPLGGALFTIEVLRLPLSSVFVIALLVCTIVAGMTSYALGGFDLDIDMTTAGASFDPSLMPFVLVIGVVCGFYSLYYSYIMKLVEHLLHKIGNPWVKNIIAGLLLSCAIAMLPALYGEGYKVDGHLLNDNPGALISDGMFACRSGGVVLLMSVSLALIAVKCFATSATNSGGGVAGEFAPTLFAGAVLGYLFAIAVEYFYGYHLPVGMFVLLGMGGVMAGAIRAPLMALMLVTEMVGAYSSFFPMLIVTALSFGVVRLFTYDDFFARHHDRPNGLISKLTHHLLK